MMINEINNNFYLDGLMRFSDQIYAHKRSEELLNAFLDSNSRGQIQSKMLALDALEKNNIKVNNALFIGQWHGLLPFFCFRQGIINSAVGIEISQIWSQISQKINSDWDWTSHCADATKPEIWQRLASQGLKFDLVINTSSEHMSFEWLDFLPPGQLVLIQSSNYDIEQHSHKVKSIEELLEKTTLSQVVFQNVLSFKNYNRFSLLGKK